MIEQWLAQAGHIALVVVGFGFLIFVHEFGHFILAKWKGVKVIKFSLGFGPAIVRFRIGETEYAVSLVPLGGYCKLAGEMMQHEGGAEKEKTREEEDVPPERLLTSKTVGQRAQIFAAGALLNLLIAFPLGVLMVLIGGDEPISKVDVDPGGAYVAGIHPGDIVTSVNGEPVHYWFEMEAAIKRAPINEPFPVTLEREGDAGTETITYEVVRESQSDDLGLNYCREKFIGFVHPAKPARRAGLKIGDEIVSVAKLGQPPVMVRRWEDFEAVARSSPGTQITITVRRENLAEEGGYETVRIPLTPDKEPYYGIGAGYGAGPAVGLVQAESPAWRAGIRAGDRIASIDGKPIRTWRDITKGIDGAELAIPIELARDGQVAHVVVERGGREDLIGIAASSSVRLIEEVEDGSPAQEAGLMAGDVLLKIDGREVGDVGTAALFDDDKQHTVEIKRGDETKLFTVTPRGEFYGLVGVQALMSSEFRRPSVTAIIPEGFGKTAGLFTLTCDALGRLVTGKASTKDMAGPVGIIKLSYMQAQTGLQKFVEFMMMISISLGIFNLLPVPVLDGGHIIFLLIEKIKGKPVSERTFVAAQYVGLALLLSLVVYVTHNDIMNFIL